MAHKHHRDYSLPTNQAPLYELLIGELTDFAVFLTNAEGRIASWHPGVEHLLGYTEDEWIGQKIDIIFTPEDHEAGVPDREIARACTDGHAPDVRWHQRKDGTRLYVEGTLVALKDSSGKLLGLSKVMRDITVRKRAEDSLRRSEARQSLLLKLMSEQREISDADSIMRNACESVGRHMNVDRVGFLETRENGMVAFQTAWTAGRLPLLTGEFPASGFGTGYIAEVRAGRGVAIADVRTNPLTKDSRFAEIGTVSLIGTPIIRKGRWHAGFYIHHAEPRTWTEEQISLAREVADLTWDAVERARAEEARRRSEERLGLALQAADAVGLWDWNAEEDLVYASGRFPKLFSIDPARAAAGVPIAQFFEAIHPADRASALSQIQQALAVAGAFSGDYRVVQKDGSERWVHALGHAYRDTNGKPSRFPGVLIDITERKEMERSLRQSEEFSRRVIESTRDCIEVLDIDAGLLSINGSGQRELGIEDFGALVNTNWLDLWKTARDRAAAEAAVALARRGLDGHFEGFLKTMHGEPRFWDVHLTPILDSDARPDRLLAVSRDITERKRAEDELTSARDEARTILESITDAFYALDREWRFIYFNAAAERITGRRRDDLLGMEHWEVFAAVIGPLAEHEYRRAVRDGTSIEFENYCEPLHRWLALRLYPTQDGGLSIYFRDITRSREKDEELRRQWRMFDTMLAQTPDHCSLYDLEGRWIYANQAVLNTLQRPIEDLAGRKCSEVISPPDSAARLERQIGQVIASGQSLRDEIEYTSADDATRYFEYIINPIFGLGGNVEAVSSTARDITERRRNEEVQRNREEQFRESARLESLGIMAGGIAHDFNNLLVGILGNASLLEETLRGSDRSIAGEIVFAGERAGELTRQMLAYSGKGRFIIEVLELNRLVRDNLTLLRASLSRNVSVELDLGCEDCFLEADASQMQQIVMNLLINASEAVGERPGRVSIRTALVERDRSLFSTSLHQAVPAGRYVTLEVSDNGIGMPRETLKKIFDPFFTTKFTGRGLGLAAVLGIVRGHKGDIEVESHPGRGTTFRVYLPAHDRAEPVRDDDVSDIPDPDPAPAGKTVLIVDDEEVVLRMATAALKKRGFRVIAATNGREALDRLRAHPDISLVILDLTMPVMTGEDALPLIRKIAPDVPVILSSGFSHVEIQRRFAASGIAGVLQKPYTVNGIIDIVARALNA